MEEDNNVIFNVVQLLLAESSIDKYKKKYANKTCRASTTDDCS